MCQDDFSHADKTCKRLYSTGWKPTDLLPAAAELICRSCEHVIVAEARKVVRLSIKHQPRAVSCDKQTEVHLLKQAACSATLVWLLSKLRKGHGSNGAIGMLVARLFLLNCASRGFSGFRCLAVMVLHQRTRVYD